MVKKAKSAEEKDFKRNTKKLGKLLSELSLAKMLYPSEVTVLEIKIHQLRMKMYGDNYSDKD